ncbi:related to CTK1 - carboxy-terminal domain (CTD) kinase, alpha subunit [Ustilago trichophora]|uniref:[RNA-polymerase]-subunit kinase n=1 Tax=Ustilago trichophora TaxID=86804 RepID=A0A5C3E043_9BASI|nr:related to CTK1 - carboxy-terminal domain (CTD) kinase, alpha subunit [Ustilago trichophora]
MPSERWQTRRNGDGDHDSAPASASRSSAIDYDRQGDSARTSQTFRRSPRPNWNGDRSEPPNKSRRLDDRVERRYDSAADRANDRDNNASLSSSSRPTDTAMLALTIRGIAATQRGSSPPTQPAKDSDDRPRRARSPDLFDRLARRTDDTNGSTRPRPESSLRSRLEGDTSRTGAYEQPRRSGTKLAPRGQYDDTGRRVDDASSSTHSRDRHRGPASRNDIPTSPRRRDGDSRRYRDRSSSPFRDRHHLRAATEQDARDRDVRPSRTDRTRTSQRSPSPISDRYDRNERRRSPVPRSTDRYALDDRNTSSTGTWRSARGPRAQHDESEQNSRLSAREGQIAVATRRRRSPSPAFSDASNRSRRRDRDQEPFKRAAWDRDGQRDSDRDQPRNRPARWSMTNDENNSDSPRTRNDRDRDVDTSADDRQRRDHRQAEPLRERRRSPDDRRARTPPRYGRADDGADRGHVLSRKTTFDGVQPPTGPRRQDPEAQQRSVRGGGWQTVRPGSRPDRREPTPRNGRDTAKVSGVGSRRSKSPVVEPPPPPPPEPARAEPGEAYESIHQVGEGTYGQVFKARSERTGALVALKKIRMDAEKDGFPVTAMREIKLLQALRHENVVRLHEMMVTRGSIYMVFEYMEHDLNGILAHPQVQFTDGHLKSLASQLFSGLDYLHRKAVLHRDLKGSNILLNNQGRLKLADFGLARFYAKRRLGDYTNRVVTLWYRPPELLFGETQYGSEVDMWGAGCIFLELFVKKPVFTSETELGQVQAITDILGPVTKENWPDVDKLAWYEMVKPATLSNGPDAGAKDYVASAFSKHLPTSALEVARGLLTYDPRQRWTAKQALASEYFKQQPKPELPARLLSALEGEWHEYESRRAKRKASGHRVNDRAAIDAAGGAGGAGGAAVVQTADSTNTSLSRGVAGREGHAAVS